MKICDININNMFYFYNDVLHQEFIQSINKIIRIVSKINNNLCCECQVKLAAKIQHSLAKALKIIQFKLNKNQLHVRVLRQ
jgi:hypothetical protein